MSSHLPLPPGVKPFTTATQVAKARRKRIVSLLVAVAAGLLAVISQRVTGDVNLVSLYLVAGFLHALDSAYTHLRLQATPSLAPATETTTSEPTPHRPVDSDIRAA